jgi:L-aminopeptidase/D-esterase-like protein
MTIDITDIEGILVGHAADAEHQTGCTALLCPSGIAASCYICGFAPGCRETPLLEPTARVEEIHGLLLSGGSAFGLGAATGVVRWLTERGHGLDTVFAKVPLVPAAVVYDLNFNQSLSKPDEAMGYAAADAASSGPVAQGNVGAGTGVTCGKLAGFDRAMKSGLGVNGMVAGDLQVAALVAANPVGDICNPDTGKVLAGVRNVDGKGLTGANSVLTELANLIPSASTENTVLGVVATNAKMTKLQLARVARMASTGIARAIRPAHMLYDGDIVFALATGQGPEADENVIGAMGADVLGRAIANAALEAVSVPGFPAARDLI